MCGIVFSMFAFIVFSNVSNVLLIECDEMDIPVLLIECDEMDLLFIG